MKPPLFKSEKERDKVRNQMSNMSWEEHRAWRRYIKENCPIPPFYQTEWGWYSKMIGLKVKGLKFDGEKIT